jgi:hypothetical protein
MIVSQPCRRGCGKQLAGLSRPIHHRQADYDRLHHICDDCLTPDEKAYMAGPMLHATARNIAGGAK